MSWIHDFYIPVSANRLIYLTAYERISGVELAKCMSMIRFASFGRLNALSIACPPFRIYILPLSTLGVEEFLSSMRAEHVASMFHGT